MPKAKATTKKSKLFTPLKISVAINVLLGLALLAVAGFVIAYVNGYLVTAVLSDSYGRSCADKTQFVKDLQQNSAVPERGKYIYNMLCHDESYAPYENKAIKTYLQANHQPYEDALFTNQ